MSYAEITKKLLKISELLQTNEQLRGENKKLAVLSAELAVYKEHIVPGYEKQLSTAKAGCNGVQAESKPPTHSHFELPVNGERPLYASDKQRHQHDVPSDVSVPNSPGPSMTMSDIQVCLRPASAI